MKLTIATPLAIIVESDGIAHLRAEDETGAFGILPGHADFLTALSVSVATWRDRDGGEHHAALRGGMLEVRDGDEIAIATREAIVSVDLHQLETEVLAAFRRGIEDERVARTDTQRTLSRSHPADLPISPLGTHRRHSRRPRLGRHR